MRWKIIKNQNKRAYEMCKMVSIFAKCGESWKGRNRARTAVILNSWILRSINLSERQSY